MFKEGSVKKVLKALPILWLVAGIVFGVGSYYGYDLMKNADRNAEQLTHQIEKKKTSQELRNQKTKEANYGTDQIKPVTPSEFANAQKHYEKIVNQWGIGSIFIPSSNIRTKILAGMDNQSLMVGVGTYYPTQQLGKGNYVGLSHNMVEGGGVLGNLPQTPLNKVIYTTDFTNIYEYLSTNMGFVDQKAVELLELPKEGEKPIITLIRCEGGLNTSKRAVVQGFFQKSYPADQASKEVKLGLGLIEEYVDDAGQPDQLEPQQSNENFSQAKQSNLTKSKEPIYSIVQLICISAFSLLSSSPLVLGSVFIFVLGVSIWISKR